MLGTQLPESFIFPWPLPTDSSARATAGRPGQVGAKIPHEIGILGRERHRGVKGFLLVVVTVNGVDELNLRIFLDLVLERFDPQILICGRRLGRNNRNLALGVRPHLSDQQLCAEPADRIARRLIDKEWPAAGRISVEGHDLDAKLLRTFHCRNDSVRIARRDRNGGHMAFGEAVDDVDLRSCARLGGAVVGDFAPGLFRGDFGAGKRRVVVGIGGRLDHHSQLEGASGQGAGDAGCAEKRARREKSGELFRHGSLFPAWFGRLTPGRWFPRRWIIAPDRNVTASFPRLFRLHVSDIKSTSPRCALACCSQILRFATNRTYVIDINRVDGGLEERRMKQRMFGRTGRMVSEVGFGSWASGEDEAGGDSRPGSSGRANDRARSRCYVH